MTSQVLYPIDIQLTGSANEIILHCKDESGKKVCVYDTKYVNYCYILLQEEYNEEEIIAYVEKYPENISIQQIVFEKKNYFSKPTPVAKIPLQVNTIPKDFIDYLRRSQMILDVLEADLPFVRKYIINNHIMPLVAHAIVTEKQNQKDYIKTIKAIPEKKLLFDKLHTLSFDIETYAPSKRINTLENPILSIAVYTNTESKVFTWSNHDTERTDILFFETEADMIQAFFAYISNCDPDIICGYNSDSFDFSYIADRCDVLRITPSFTNSNHKLVFSGGSERQAHIKGIPHIDLYHFIRTTMRGQLQTNSYSLNAVSKELLGDTKKDVDISKLYIAWDTKDIQTLDMYMEYNIHDTKLCFDLLSYLFANMLEFVHMIRLPLQDITRMTYSQLVEWYLICHVEQFNLLIPPKPNGYELDARLAKPRIEGAFVFKPTPGFYKNIAVFDFQSLYPTIIASLNLEKDTMRKEGTTDEKVPEVDEILYFSKKTPGFIPSVIKEIVLRRIEVKKELKQTTDSVLQSLLKARIYNLKILANSMYGYLAFVHARWHCQEAASATTAYARHYIKATIAKAQEQGFVVLYSDTDSIFLDLQGKTTNDAKQFVLDWNTTLPGIMELQFEDFFNTGVFVSAKGSSEGAKKRYALYNTEHDKFKITGFESVRTDWSLLARNAQKEVISFLLKKQDKNAAFQYVREMIAAIQEKSLSLSDFMLQSKLSRNPEDYETNLPQVTIAKRMIARGDSASKGTIVSYIVGNGSGNLYERVVEIEEASLSQIDTKYYIDHQLIPAVLPLMELFGYNKDDFFSNTSQGSLSDFF